MRVGEKCESRDLLWKRRASRTRVREMCEGSKT